MRWIILALALAAVAITIGCTGNSKAEPTLANEPPYWCELVPKKALVEIQELEDDKTFATKQVLGEKILSTDDYGCRVKIPDQFRLILGVYVYRDEIARRELPGKLGRTDLGSAVPPRLGRGRASYNEGWVLWRCNGHAILIFLDLYDSFGGTPEIEPQVIRLLEIAQQRYTELANCEVHPPTITPSAIESG